MATVLQPYPEVAPVPGPAALAEAFCSFSQAAVYLEQSYRDLQIDVRRLKEQLAHTNQQLAESLRETERVRAMGEISAVLAHEIRNPLASLELFAELLGDEVDPAGPSREWLEQIYAGVRLLSATVDNVLQFHSQAPLQLKGVNLSELVEGVVRFVGPVARQRRISIEENMPFGDCAISADANRLKQVFMNLCLNGFRAMQAGQRLKISVLASTRLENAWDVLVRDEGRGIPEQYIAKIFDAGFSVDRQSTGLGLTICKSIVELHGGLIAVENNRDRGATFAITLPQGGSLEPSTGC